MMDQFSDIEIMARTLYGEARGEVAKVGIIALEAIASVICNRVQYPKRFGRTHRDVCLQPYQFSCWNIADPNRCRLLQPSLDDGIITLCRRVAQAYLEGEGGDVTGGADHYYAHSIRPPFWAADKVPVTEIGAHRFYKLC